MRFWNSFSKSVWSCLKREINLMQACSANQHQVIMPSWLPKVPSWLRKNALCLSQSAFSNFALHVITALSKYLVFSLSLNPLNPEAFYEKGISWTFWWFLGSISVKLPSIWSKCTCITTAWLSCHWHRDLRHFDSGMRRNQDFEIFFGLSFFSFSFLFAAVIDLLLGLLAVKKLLGKRHRDGQFSPWSSPV